MGYDGATSEGNRIATAARGLNVGAWHRDQVVTLWPSRIT